VAVRVWYFGGRAGRVKSRGSRMGDELMFHVCIRLADPEEFVEDGEFFAEEFFKNYLEDLIRGGQFKSSLEHFDVMTEKEYVG
jgi:hypothetical protein